MLKKLTAFALFVLLAGLILNATISGVLSNKAEAAVTLPSVPAGLKSTFMLGLANQPGNVGWMNNSGAKWDARYQYLCGGVTGSGWATWNSPAGAFARYYMDDSANNGYLPVLTYYNMLQSSPASGANEADKDYNNLNNPSTMNAYYNDFKVLMDQARGFGKPVVVHVEPDLWGFLQKRSTDPNAISASVASSGNGEVAGQPNTVAGFAKALVALKNKYAPNVVLGFHVSPWGASNGDISSSKDPNFNVQGAAQETANFYLKMGANFDLLFYDIADRDAALYASWGDPNRWWDVNNATFPNFNRFHQYVSTITSMTSKRGIVWQIPIGNTLYRSMNNTTHHWQDNRVQYYLNDSGAQHLQDAANAGIIGFLFGAGDGQTSSYDDGAGDGVTNPNAINGNNLTTTFSDDDGGYLRLQGQNYYKRGALSLPSSGATPPPPSATTPVAATATPTAASAPNAPASWVLTSKVSGTLAANSSLTITSNFTAPAGSNGSFLADIEVYNVGNGAKVAQWTPVQNFAAGQTQSFNNNIQLPAGSYVVKMGLFTPAWSFIAWNDSAITFQVAASAAPTPTKAAPTATPVPPTATKAPTVAPTATKAPATPTSGGMVTGTPPASWVLTSKVSGTLTANSSTTVTSSFTAPVGANGSFLCDIEVYNLATGAKVAQWFPVQNFTAGQLQSFNNNLQLPAGSYVVKMGLFTPAWSFIAWNDSAITFQVK